MLLTLAGDLLLVFIDPRPLLFLTILLSLNFQLLIKLSIKHTIKTWGFNKRNWGFGKHLN